MIIFRGNIEKERQDIKINPKNKKITADFEMKVKLQANKQVIYLRDLVLLFTCSNHVRIFVLIGCVNKLISKLGTQ